MSDANFHNNTFFHKYIADLGSRIVSETGISSDKYHLGKLILRSLKDDPDFVMQIDGGTGESETNGSVLRRTVQCAASMKTMGLKTGDVMILMAPNHLDLAIPLYAALCLGVTVAAVKHNFYSANQLPDIFKMKKPKIIFCQSDKVLDVQKALQLLEHDAAVISFDKNEHTLNFKEMLEKSADVNVEEFEATNFDPEETIGFIIATSGTTGIPKRAAVTHKGILINGRLAGTQSALMLFPLQGLSVLIYFIFGPFVKCTRIQTSKPATPEHIIDIINKYKPESVLITPAIITRWVELYSEKMDMSCFKYIFLGGSVVPKTLMLKIQNLLPNALVVNGMGMSELAGPSFNCLGCPPGSLGTQASHFQYKLVDICTGEEIEEPNRSGELWMKGDGIFKGYYNNPEATSEAFTKDNWFKTGDIMYRDEHWNYYYVDRIKSLLKYKGFQVSPIELETLINEHPDVLDVVVTGIPDPECDELIAACVVPRPGVNISGQEIQDLVKENIPESKQLRGGVYFVEEIPLTSTGKADRQKIKKMVITLAREQSENK